MRGVILCVGGKGGPGEGMHLYRACGWAQGAKGHTQHVVHHGKQADGGSDEGAASGRNLQAAEGVMRERGYWRHNRAHTGKHSRSILGPHPSSVLYIPLSLYCTAHCHSISPLAPTPSPVHLLVGQLDGVDTTQLLTP